MKHEKCSSFANLPEIPYESFKILTMPHKKCQMDITKYSTQSDLLMLDVNNCCTFSMLQCNFEMSLVWQLKVLFGFCAFEIPIYTYNVCDIEHYSIYLSNINLYPYKWLLKPLDFYNGIIHEINTICQKFAWVALHFVIFSSMRNDVKFSVPVYLQWHAQFWMEKKGWESIISIMAWNYNIWNDRFSATIHLCTYFVFILFDSINWIRQWNRVRIHLLKIEFPFRWRFF